MRDAAPRLTVALSGLARKDALPRADFRSAKVVGEQYKRRNLVNACGLCQTQFAPGVTNSAAATGAGRRIRDRRGKRRMERETGLEPATLSLEG